MVKKIVLIITGIIFWLFILSFLIIKNKKWNKKIKVLLIFFIWFVFLLYVFLNIKNQKGNLLSYKKNSTTNIEKNTKPQLTLTSKIISPLISQVAITPTIISSPKTDFYQVAKVIDGDTIKIEGGEIVRYIGIDAPETVNPKKPIECYGKEAADKNRELVEGKKVRLEKDISERDKYGRLLRYVWLDQIMVNEYLVKEGYAQATTWPPDVKYQERFLTAEKEARENKKGLWSDDACLMINNYIKPTKLLPVNNSDNSFVCDCDKTCSMISSCEEAYFQLNYCGCQMRDSDGDGIPCEAICK